MKRRNQQWKMLGAAALAVFLIFIIYRMFEGSWSEIASVLLESRPIFLLLILFCGLAWYTLDAFVYWILFRAAKAPISFANCVRAAMISIFCDVTTMGAGTKPAQVWYCHKKGAPIGSCAGILMMPYLVQKTLVVLFALGGFITQRAFMETEFGGVLQYIYLGAVGSIAISAGLLLVCVCQPVHRAVIAVLNFVFRASRWDSLKKAICSQLETLAECSRAILGAPKTTAKMIAIMALKLLVQYMVPVGALLALYGNLQGATFFEVLAMGAVMKLIMGVIPTSGGVGSLEVVFALLFKAVFGDITGASVMVLFRVATYYFPFLISVALVRSILLQKESDHNE